MTNLELRMTHEPGSTETQAFGGRGRGPGAASATAMARQPGEVAGHTISREIDVVQCFHEQLARFRAYGEYLGQAPQVVSVSFQCLVDHQDNEVAEVLGVVAL